MSFIRVVRYGQPVDPDLFVDLGPSVGRTSHTRLQGGSRSLIAGELVSGESGNSAQRAHAEAKKRRLAAKRAAEVDGRQSDRRILDAVVRCGSQSRAAEAECVSLSFVSHALGRLVAIGDPVAIKWSKRGRIPPRRQP